MLDTGCLMLVENSVFSGDNKRESFENSVSLRGVGSTLSPSCMLYEPEAGL